MFRNKARFYGEDFWAPRPNLQAGGPPLVSCPRLLIQYIRSCLLYWRPFLHPRARHAALTGANLSYSIIFIAKFFAINLHCLCNFVFVYDVCPKAEGIWLHNGEEMYTLLSVMGQRIDTNRCITRSLLMCRFTMVTESIAVLRSWTICKAVWCQSHLSIV